MRKAPEEVRRRLERRGISLDLQHYQALESRRRELQVRTENLQARRNELSRNIGKRIGAGENAAQLRAQVAAVGVELDAIRHQNEEAQQALTRWLERLPNPPHDSVPDGLDSASNREMRRWGEIPQFGFEPRDHVAIGEAFGLDLETATMLSGSRFMVLRGPLARLHRAIAALMLDTHSEEHSYQECYTPYIVNGATLFGTGQLPRFEEDLFEVLAGSREHQHRPAELPSGAVQGEPSESLRERLFLIPTSEVSLTNFVAGRILEEAQLPVRLTAHTPCFRSEAGSHGRDTRGLIRQHQFDKVEMVQIVQPQRSYAALEEMVGHAETVLQKLELPYRVMLLCAGDMGFGAAKTYDLEVWLPGQGAYREISSCSNCESFQARRMTARFRNAEGKPELLHTLNGSGVAVGRALVALLEVHQQADGRVKIPAALRSYMGSREWL
jgi:seryl-tRNA synthetase